MEKLVLLMALLITLTTGAQDTRYFEFSSFQGLNGSWQDTSFVAATTDQEVIDTVLANMERPFDQRKFIGGPIDYGSGGFNHNASHVFSWHFIPDQWDLQELAAEYCDGRPYTDVDSNTEYWVENIGQYCPWSGKPSREIAPPELTDGVGYLSNQFRIYPNPAEDRVFIEGQEITVLAITMYNIQGREILSKNPVNNRSFSVDLSDLISGIYFLEITTERGIAIKKLVKGS